MEIMSHRYSFRLKPGRDQDLIAWLENLGEGERSFFIRNTLRKAIMENLKIVDISLKDQFKPKVEAVILTQNDNERVDEASDAENKFNKLLDTF